MKHFIFILIVLVLVTACDEPVVNSAPVNKPALEFVKLEKLAWGDAHPEWDKALYSELNNYKGFEFETPCKKLNTVNCAAQLLSIMAKYESNYKPETTYKENFKDANGYVISRGLFQISKLSANQSAYNCKIKDEKELHNPLTNIKCAVKILAYQAKKSGSLINGDRGGASSYWAVARKSSKSYKKILDYMSNF